MSNGMYYTLTMICLLCGLYIVGSIAEQAIYHQDLICQEGC